MFFKTKEATDENQLLNMFFWLNWIAIWQKHKHDVIVHLKAVIIWEKNVLNQNLRKFIQKLPKLKD